MRPIFAKIGEWLLYIFAFLLPWQARWIFFEGSIEKGYWEYGSFSLYGFDILLLVLLIITVIIGRKKHFYINRFTLAALGLFLVAFFSLYWAIDKDIALYAFARLLAAILLIIVVWQIKFKPLFLAGAIALAGVCQSVLAAWQFFTQKAIAFKWLGMAEHLPWILGDQVVEFVGGRMLRAYGSFPHPNMLAAFLAIAIILSIGIYLKSSNKWGKYFALASLVINSAGLFFTFSRAAWIGLFITLFFYGLLIFWIYHRRELDYIKLFAAILMPFILLSAIYPALVLTRFGLGDDFERLEIKSIEQRADYTDQALEIIKANFMTGIGIGNYTWAVHEQLDDDLESYDYQPVHNVYLLILAELGVFGLLFFIYLIAAVLLKIDLKSRLNLAFAMCFLFFAFIAFFDHFLWTMAVGLYLLFLIFAINSKLSLTK